MKREEIITVLQATGASEEQIQEATEKLAAMAQAEEEKRETLPQLQPEELMELVLQGVRKGMEGVSAVDRKFAMFPTDQPGDEGKDKKERMKRFLGAVLRNDVAGAQEISQRALSEGVDSAGGSLVPEEFQTDIYRVIEQNRLIRQFATQVTMGTDVKNLTSLTAKVTANWTGEGQKFTESTPGVGRPILYAKKLGGISLITDELQADSPEEVYSLLVELFAEAFGEKEDYEGLRGDGTIFTGALNHADAQVVDMGSGDTDFSDITFDYLGKLIGKLTDARKAGARFIFHRDMVQHLESLKTSTGAYLWAGTTSAGGPPTTIRGYPWSTSDQMPGDADTDVSTVFAIFGNLRWVAFGDRKAVTIEMLKEATIGTTNLGEQGMKALRLEERVGVVVLMGDCFAVLKTAAS